jgi:hypothetical protein
MEPNEYIAFYQFPIGTKVTIKECHAKPELAGKAGVAAGWVDKEMFGYPLMVYLDEPIYIPITQLGGGIAVPYQGPHFCRPDELTVVGKPANDIPDAFKFWKDVGGENDDKK